MTTIHLFRGSVYVLVASLLLAAIPAHAERHEVRTEHLIFEYEDGAIGEEGLAYAKEQGERWYQAIADMLGHHPDARIRILLNGNAQQPDGSWGYPRVDGLGRVHLYKYTPDDKNHFNAMAHEMVHAFRFRRDARMDWFLEEGFAEFVALSVDSSLGGFPWFETPTVIAAGQWFASNEEIPLAVLRERHSDLNMKCKAQAYTLRSSFFEYLGTTFGADHVVELAALEGAGTDEHYQLVFGKSFTELTGDWKAWLASAYNDIADAESKARYYRTQSPLKYQNVCAPDDIN